MFGGPTKPLQQMTNREIISSIVVFVLVGGFLIVMNFRLLIIGGNWFSIAWGVIGTIFVAMVLLGCIPRGVLELWRRRQRHAQSKRESV